MCCHLAYQITTSVNNITAFHMKDTHLHACAHRHSYRVDKQWFTSFPQIKAELPDIKILIGSWKRYFDKQMFWKTIHVEVYKLCV